MNTFVPYLLGLSNHKNVKYDPTMTKKSLNPNRAEGKVCSMLSVAARGREAQAPETVKPTHSTPVARRVPGLWGFARLRVP